MLDELIPDTPKVLPRSSSIEPATNIKARLTKILRNFFFDHDRQKKRWVSTEDLAQPQSDLESLPAENPGPERRLLLSELEIKLPMF